MLKRSLFRGCLVIVVAVLLTLLVINVITFVVIPTSNQNKWNDTKPQSYSFTVHYGTFGAIYTHHEERVIDGRSQTEDQSTATVSAIDELFNRIKGCAFNPLAVLMCSVEYDPVYGYPVRFSENDLDLGEVVEVRDFAPDREQP